jgi:exosortase
MTGPRLVRLTAVAAAAASLVWLYAPVLRRLARDWATDDNYSHGWLIGPLALYFLWERRKAFSEAPRNPTWSGLAVVLGGLAMLLAGMLGAELFLPRLSLIVVLAGSALFLWGARTARVAAFPLAFLLLMIPIPAILFNQIAFPLQLIASQVGQAGLETAGVPVLREGNVMRLANTSLEVAEACSGIRSLISLLTLGIVYGYFTDPRSWVRAAIALSTIPIAILTNGARVAGTGVAAHYYGPEAAEGFFHTFSGWIVFVAAFVLMFAFVRVLLKVSPPTPPVPRHVASAA